MNERVCLVCGRPSSPGATHPACEFCGGVFETIGEPVERSCYRCGARFASDTASTETFCPACAAAREVAPAPPPPTLHPLVRDFVDGARNGVLALVGFALLRHFEFRGELCLLAVLLLTPIALSRDLFTTEAQERRARWSLRSFVQSAGMLLVFALAWAVWSSLR